MASDPANLRARAHAGYRLGYHVCHRPYTLPLPRPRPHHNARRHLAVGAGVGVDAADVVRVDQRLAQCGP